MPDRPRIAVLPTQVAEQVAAGEVIQRPGDVVKELIENAVDAVLVRRTGAEERVGAIQVELRTGGLELIRVVDDGCGIAAEELEVALARHGTSKLREVDDLGRVATLGFRGEALPSVGAVADLTILSRPADAAAGAFVRVDGGRIVERGARGCPVGTQVTVRQLFQGTPARLAFQRSPAGEAAHVAHLVGTYALAYPELRLELTVDGRRVLQVGPGSTADAFDAIYGPPASGAALAVDHVDPAGVRVHGLISAPELTRGRRGDILLFVNRRPVQNRSLTHAVVDAYRGFLPEGRYPLAALYVELDPAEIDVNVHPAKADVRFRRDRLVYATLQRAIRAALLAEAPAPAISAPLRSASPAASTAADWSTPPTARLPGLDATRPRDAWPSGLTTPRPTAGPDRGPAPWPDTASPPIAPSEWPPGGPPPGGLPAGHADEHDRAAGTPLREGWGDPPQALQGRAGGKMVPGGGATATPDSGRLPILRIVGQVQGTYIVCEGPDGVYFVDQHAAHERVRYEEVLAQRAAGGVGSQRLLEPSVIDLDGRRAALLAQHAADLAALGLEAEPFGDRSALVRSVPAGLRNADPGRLLPELLDALDDPTPTIDGLDRAAATVACHSSVRAGDPLSLELMRSLIERLEGTDVGRFCPHGRPTVVRLPVTQLERDFGRR